MRNLLPLGPGTPSPLGSLLFPFGSSARTRRPLGLWLLPVFDGFFAGVLPAVTAIVGFLAAAPGARPPATEVFWPLLAGAAVIASAEATWRGERWGRLALTAAITVYYGIVGMGEPPLGLDLALTGDERMLAQVLYVARATFWIGLHGWVLFLSDVRKVFR